MCSSRMQLARSNCCIVDKSCRWCLSPCTRALTLGVCCSLRTAVIPIIRPAISVIATHKSRFQHSCGIKAVYSNLPDYTRFWSKCSRRNTQLTSLVSIVSTEGQRRNITSTSTWLRSEEQWFMVAKRERLVRVRVLGVGAVPEF